MALTPDETAAAYKRVHDDLQKVCERHGCPPGQFKIRWLDAEMARRQKSLQDAADAVEAIMDGKPGFDMPSLLAGLRRAAKTTGHE